MLIMQPFEIELMPVHHMTYSHCQQVKTPRNLSVEQYVPALPSQGLLFYNSRATYICKTEDTSLKQKVL